MSFVKKADVMVDKCSKQDVLDCPPRAARSWLAVLFSIIFINLALPGAALAQEAWRGLTVPKYPDATNYRIKTDSDEYDIYFSSQDNVKTVFEFYVNYLRQQGFSITESRPTKYGHKARLARGRGGPNDTIELDAKPKHGHYKVEIEFDE